ncbi:aspartate/glutamate racemase family protein [Photobacterium minamisatsumaniensis]|uniref:aspartate/glutamate racemase family protein n=1 Tax=Photobacterium minamisatsumaniensis TaxID=2910233 RepID=UPI003D14176B
MQSNGIDTPNRKVGVIMLNTHFPRLLGDIGNPDTFCCDTLYRRVDIATVSSVITNTGVSSDVANAIFNAAIELETEGADIVLTSCGFLGELQKELEQRIAIPMLSSSLVILPFIRSVYGLSATIGIMTFDSRKLRPIHFNGNYDEKMVIQGVENGQELHRVISNDLLEIDKEKAELDVLLATRELMKSNPKAIVLECTNLSPYIDAIREESGLPVYDLIQATNWLLDA